jgi:predicted metal-dependent phosphoesterase TrpH
MTRIDLHSHTFLSDGQFSPNELAQLMEEKGVQVFSITDHDCFDAYENLSLPPPLELIPGVEFSVHFDSYEWHILGYFPSSFASNPPALLQQFLRETQQSRKKRALEFVQYLGKCGIQVTWNDIQRFQKGPVLTRYHLAQTLAALGYTKSVDAGFKRFLHYKNSVMKKTENQAETVLDLIHQLKGLAFWAHPPLEQLPKYLPQLVERGLDGIEMVRSSGILIRELRERYKLLLSWGTDFHYYRRDRNLGMLADEVLFQEFRQRLEA